MPSIEILNAWGENWAAYMWGSLVDTAVILAVVAAVWTILRRWMPAQLGYCLFLLVLVKLCVPVHFTVPGGAAVLSPQYAIERFSNWATSDATTETAGPKHAGMQAEDDALLEEMLLVRGAADGRDAPTAPTVASPRLSIAAMLMGGWSLTVLALLGWFACNQVRLARALRRAEPFEPGSLPVDLGELKRLAGVSQPVRLLASNAVRAPAIGGCLRPSIVLPAGLAETLTAKQVRWVLLHELAHVRRRDLWVATFQRLVQIAQFFNPAVWLANRMIDQQREYACDDTALAASTASRRGCGAAFLSVVERANSEPARLAPALGIFSAKHCVKRRLMRILDTNRPVRTRFSMGSTVVFLALAALLLPRLQAASGGDAIQDSQSHSTNPKTEPVEVQPQHERAAERRVGRAGRYGTAGRARGPDRNDAADEEAERYLTNLGVVIVRDEGGDVVFVNTWNARRPIEDSDLRYFTNLHWSSARSTYRTRPWTLQPLPRLTLFRTRITDDGLLTLRSLTSLRMLDLNGSASITDESVPYLANFPELERLWLPGTGITDAGVEHLSKLELPKLKNLWISGPRMTNASLASLKTMKQLAGLAILHAPITDAGLVHLKEMNLTSLDFRNTQITDDGLRHLSDLKSLKRLVLAENQLTDAGLNHLAGLTNLEVLELDDTEVTDAWMEHLDSFPRMIWLRLNDTSISDAGLGHLDSLSHLLHLDLNRTKVTGAGLELLSGLDNLTNLYLDGTQTTDDGLVHLEGLTKLQLLRLAGTPVTDDGLDHLSGLTRLQKLNLRGTAISEQGREKLQAALPNCLIDMTRSQYR